MNSSTKGKINQHGKCRRANQIAQKIKLADNACQCAGRVVFHKIIIIENTTKSMSEMRRSISAPA